LVQDETSFEKRDSAFTQYTLRKGNFIRQILKEAGFNRLRFLKCNDNTEWNAAKHFRQTYFFDNVPMADPYTWTFNHPDHVHFVLYQGVEIIGYAHIQLWPAARAALRIIVIEEEKRQQGFGGHFLKMLEKWLKVQGYKSLHTEASPDAYLFYKKFKYTEMPFDDPDNHPTDPRDIPIGKHL
jgi:GNAT superfamily N-acetyltransferase